MEERANYMYIFHSDSSVAEVDCLADEGDGAQAGEPALEGVDRAWGGEQGAASRGPEHAGLYFRLCLYFRKNHLQVGRGSPPGNCFEHPCSEHDASSRQTSWCGCHAVMVSHSALCLGTSIVLDVGASVAVNPDFFRDALHAVELYIQRLVRPITEHCKGMSRLGEGAVRPEASGVPGSGWGSRSKQ